MRITTAMLNEAKAEAGITTQTKSLLNYINDDNKNTLMSSLGATQSTKVTSMQKSNYEKLETASEKLYDNISKLSSASKTDDSEEDTDELYSEIEDFVDNYNSTVKALKYTTGTLDTYYAKMLKEAATDSTEELENVGVTINSDGTFELDKTKLNATDPETLESMFGKNSEFMAKAALIVEHINENASASVDNLSSKYNSTGSTYSAVSSKYNILG